MTPIRNSCESRLASKSNLFQCFSGRACVQHYYSSGPREIWEQKWSKVVSSAVLHLTWEANFCEHMSDSYDMNTYNTRFAEVD